MAAAKAGHLASRLNTPSQKPRDAVWTTAAGRSLVAHPTSDFSANRAMMATLGVIRYALEVAGIHYVGQHRWPELPTLGIPADQWEAALTALANVDDALLYTAVDGTFKPMSARLSSTKEPRLRVFMAWATPGGRYLAGPDVGVALSTEIDAPQLHPSPEIDFVFTWVDGADPAWQARKTERQTRHGHTADLHAMSHNDARYASFDELKYALRAVEMFAPWYRRIHLVTDQQVPTWLNRDHPNLVVVDHREIFDDPSALPTFNSHAIESRLHHIPGLAEHYVYFNDDVFLGRYTPPSVFFDRIGHLRVFLAAEEIPPGAATPDDQPVVAAAKNNRAVLESLTGATLHHKLKHVPHPQLRSVAFELEDNARSHFDRTSRSAFRAAEDLSIASSLLPHYALATGRGSLGSISHFYADVDSPEIRWRLPQLLEHRDAAIICLNATASAPAANTRRLLNFLERYYPIPGNFEQRPASPPTRHPAT